MIDQVKRSRSLARIFLGLCTLTAFGLLISNYWHPRSFSDEMISTPLLTREKVTYSKHELTNMSLPPEKYAKYSNTITTNSSFLNDVLTNNIRVEKPINRETKILHELLPREKSALRNMVTGRADTRFEDSQIDDDSNNNESWNPEVEAELNGYGTFFPVTFALNQVPVTDDNVDAMPSDEFAVEVLIGYPEFREYEGDLNNPGTNPHPPNGENISMVELGEFAEQIDQSILDVQALDGESESESSLRIELNEVNPESHPPTETSVFINIGIRERADKKLQ